MIRRPLTALTLLLTLVCAQGAAAQAPVTDPRAPTLTASLDADAEKPTVVVRYGATASLRGLLVDADGKPMPGAEVRLTSRALVTGADDLPAGTLITESDGTFSVRLPAGPSRRLTLSHRRAQGDTAPVAVAKATLLVRAGVRLRATPSALRNGQTLRLRVELLGRPFPQAGKFVDLQVRRAGKWLNFASIRARNGRLTYTYRFQNTRRKRTLLFRAQVPAFSTYPYIRGVSRAARVIVRPRLRKPR